MNRISTILQSGSVMSTRFRVYESHLSFILQFLCDFGLYGCGFIELEDVFERCAEEQPELGFSAQPTPRPSKSSSYFRESRLPLEVDAIAPHILNRHSLAARNVHHRLEIPAPLLPSEPLVLGVRELWEDERNRRLTLGLDPSPQLPIDPSESSRGVGGDWVAEAHWWDEIRHRIQNTPNSNEGLHENRSEDWERFVMTTFESIEAIWEKEYKVWKPAKEEVVGAENVDPVVQRDRTDNGPDQGETDNQVDVDISKLSNQDISELDQQEALGEGWNKTTEQAQQDHDDNEGEVEEVVLEDDLAEELVDVNKVEDNHTPRSALLLYFFLRVIADTYLVQKILFCRVRKRDALKHLID
jgi:DNA polymerase zeta